MTDQVRVRFAPSPTGELHIGGARTAIYNWAFARSCGGSFILRIEDTDPVRSTEENKQVILRSMEWLGLDWDEGPDKAGDFGPYLQSERVDSYQDALEILKANDAVYPCFCTKEELDEKRSVAEKADGGYSGYDGTCRCLDPDEAAARIDRGEPYVWRLKVPTDHCAIEFNDAVYGEMAFPADVMDDMIMVRSDGSATYNFAVVCDDVNMKITHVIRGDDHLSNTPRQILIYEALGQPVPTFAHLPMILGSDGKKLSKRRNATSVEEYKERGYLSDALVNFLALLGWSLDGETTIISRQEMISSFTLDRINKKDAVFDETKLDWMNGTYIKDMGADNWLSLATPWLIQAGASPEAIDSRDQWFKELYPLVSERLVRLDEIPSKLNYMFWGKAVELDETSVNKVLLKEGVRADEALRGCLEIVTDTSIVWEHESLEQSFRSLAERLDMKPKLVLQPLRVAVCGNMVSPPLFESLELLERNDVKARIEHTLTTIFA